MRARLGPALEREYPIPDRRTTETVARGSHVRQRAPAPRSRIEQLYLGDGRAARLELLAAEHDDAPVAQPDGRDAAARRPQVGETLPVPAGVVALRAAPRFVESRPANT